VPKKEGGNLTSGVEIRTRPNAAVGLADAGVEYRPPIFFYLMDLPTKGCSISTRMREREWESILLCCDPLRR
jgi:hypothetical protein